MRRLTSARFTRAIFISFVFLSTLGIISPSVSWGDVLAVGSHKVVGVADLGDGTFEVTFDLTLSNQGSTSLSDVTLVSIPAYFQELDPFSSEATLATLPAWSTVHVQWTMITPITTSAVPDERSLFLHGEGVDVFGDTIAFSVICEEEARP